MASIRTPAPAPMINPYSVADCDAIFDALDSARKRGMKPVNRDFWARESIQDLALLYLPLKESSSLEPGAREDRKRKLRALLKSIDRLIQSNVAGAVHDAVQEIEMAEWWVLNSHGHCQRRSKIGPNGGVGLVHLA